MGQSDCAPLALVFIFVPSLWCCLYGFRIPQSWVLMLWPLLSLKSGFCCFGSPFQILSLLISLLNTRRQSLFSKNVRRHKYQDYKSFDLKHMHIYVHCNMISTCQDWKIAQISKHINGKIIMIYMYIYMHREMLLSPRRR